MSFVGFTGTQQGMTDRQWRTVCELVRDRAVERAIHGGCAGADFDFHRIVRAIDASIHVFPCTFKEKWPDPIRALTIYDAIDVAWRKHGAAAVYPPKAPLDRNVDMVRYIASLNGWWIATPKGFAEELRSGTWYTVRRVRRAGIPHCIVWPDGEVEEH